MFSSFNEVSAAIDAALRSCLVTPLAGAPLAAAITAIRTSAVYIDHTGATKFSADSIRSAVNSYALAQSLPLRDGIANAARIAAGLV